MSSATDDNAFLGRGWAFPPSFNRLTGSAAMVSGAPSIEQSLRLIFAIAPGQRKMMPAFGCDLAQFLFQPLDLSLTTMIETTVRRAILDYEPRINVNDVIVIPGADIARQEVLVTVDYTIRTTNRRGNFVYPYYLNEATGVPL